METKDISKEFKEMDLFEFDKYVMGIEREKRKTGEEILLIIHSEDISKAKRLKAIKERTNYQKIKFQCEIEATIEDYRIELNVFASGIKWIEKR